MSDSGISKTAGLFRSIGSAVGYVRRLVPVGGSVKAARKKSAAPKPPPRPAPPPDAKGLGGAGQRLAVLVHRLGFTGGSVRSVGGGGQAEQGQGNGGEQ
jgi:hypothetical protein